MANNIAQLRKSKGLTQLELAERLNYSDKAVSKWERGEGLPDVLVLSKMAEIFDVTLAELVDGARSSLPRHRCLCGWLPQSFLWCSVCCRSRPTKPGLRLFTRCPQQ